MGLNAPKKVFSNDILRVEMSGPHQPHLTMVDLPGLFQAGNSAQSDDNAELVTDMVMRYAMRRRPRRKMPQRINGAFRRTPHSRKMHWSAVGEIVSIFTPEPEPELKGEAYAEDPATDSSTHDYSWRLGSKMAKKEVVTALCRRWARSD